MSDIYTQKIRICHDYVNMKYNEWIELVSDKSVKKCMILLWLEGLYKDEVFQQLIHEHSYNDNVFHCICNQIELFLYLEFS